MTDVLGRSGPSTLEHAQCRPWRVNARNWHVRSNKFLCCNSCFFVSGNDCATRPQAKASSWSVTSRSSSPTTAPMSGHGPNCSIWTRTASRRWWPACHQTTSAPPASCGAIPSTIGGGTRRRTLLGGRSDSPRFYVWSMWCGSTTFAASRPTGKFPETPRPPSAGTG